MLGDLGHHMHKREPSLEQSDVLNGAFWKRHWQLDAKVVKLQIVLPHLIRTGMGLDFREGEISIVNLYLQALVIGLYKSAGLKAEKWQLGESITRQCAARCAAASVEVVKAVKRADSSSINKVCLLPIVII